MDFLFTPDITPLNQDLIVYLQSHQIHGTVILVTKIKDPNANNGGIPFTSGFRSFQPSAGLQES